MLARSPRHLVNRTEGIDMTRIHLLTVAAVCCAVVCTDTPDALTGRPIDPEGPSQPATSTAAIAGRIRVTGDTADRVVELRDADGDVFRLLGSMSSVLASVDGGDVVVWGTFDSTPGFVVQQFKVAGMHGGPALDGVLEATAGGFALRMADGSLRAVPGLRSDGAKYVGSRVWVIGWEENAGVVIGVIGRCHSAPTASDSCLRKHSS